MIDELNRALKGYDAKWQKLVAGRKDKAFFETLKPTAVGWKVSDQDDYRRRYLELHEICDRIIETWMNGRWIAKMHLKDTKLEGGITIIKLMQRRPGSGDALDLDHVDFYSPELVHAESILREEPNLKWTHETNDVVDNYDWISIWFEETEAKLKSSTVLDIVIIELQDLARQIKG